LDFRFVLQSRKRMPQIVKANAGQCCLFEGGIEAVLEQVARAI
jgi:hypothetical protein